MAAGEKARRAPVTLVAKAVGFKTGRTKSFEPPAIDALLRRVLQDAKTVASRHYPAPEAIKAGDQCHFINRWRDVGSSGVILEICSYHQGLVPESMATDLYAPEIELQKVNLDDEEGKKRELVSSFRLIACGQLLILQMARGSGGGAGAVQTLLTGLFRRLLVEPRFPSVDLGDLGSADLRALIRQKGGIKRLEAKVTVATPITESRFSEMLADVRKRVGNASECKIVWDADGVLDEASAVEALTESEDSVLDSVVLHFKHGGSVNNLSKYRERRLVQVQVLNDGRLATNEIESELKQYIDDLRHPGSDAPVATDGTLRKDEVLTITVK